MLTRREFGAIAGATTLGLAMRPARGQGAAPQMRFGNAAGIADAQLSFVTVGKHPKVGFYKEEGIDADLVNMNSASQTLASLAQDQVEFATLSVGTYLPLFAKNPTLNVVSAYLFLPQNLLLVGVKPDSPIQSIADLKGKTIGIRNTGDTGYAGMLGMFRELGLDPNRDAQWLSVGTGGPAGAALYNGSVDALSIWDAELARVEIAGFKLRYLPNTPKAQKLSGTSFGVSRTGLEKNRERYVGLFRGIAKSTVFAATNPELAIRMHWELYPESKPKGKTESDALADALYVMKVRRDKWFAPAWRADKRLGANSLEDWEAQIAFVGQQLPEVRTIKDPARLFTNEIIDDANKFDRAAVEKLAQTVTL